RTSTVSRKNTTTLNFVQSRVLIDFLCTISKFQNIGHSQLIRPWDGVRARFHKKIRRS
ncbi:hypothetical protein BHE74_00039696, partial [Ensete ventricosum]